MYEDYSIKLTEDQQATLSKVIELLTPSNKEDACYTTVYFTQNNRSEC